MTDSKHAYLDALQNQIDVVQTILKSELLTVEIRAILKGIVKTATEERNDQQ